ncbi:MAG: hypothetical protein IIW58_03580 [Bacteroidales bacterium]|nr:hypothetical protein [Bacteroidales bacterium]
MEEKIETIGRFIDSSNNFLESLKENCCNEEEKLTTTRIIEGYKIVFGLLAGNNTDNKFEQLQKITNAIDNN